MARGSNTAQASANQATQNSDALTGNANGIYSTLLPQLETEAANPQGYSPSTIAGMNTAAQQSAGGATSGASGRGALLAGRTRNAGSAAEAIDSAARTGGQQLSNAALGVQNDNAQLKAREQQQGLQGMEGIYGTDVSGANGALGEVAPLVNANTQDENASYGAFTNIINPLLGAASNSKYF